MLKVALQLREHDFPAEVLDFQVCWNDFANELVVRFNFFIRCFVSSNFVSADFGKGSFPKRDNPVLQVTVGQKRRSGGY